MKRFHGLIFAAAALAAFIAASVPAAASSAVLCAPERAGAVSGNRQFTNPTTGTSYGLDNRGCALIALADIGFFRSQGFLDGPALRTIVYDTGTALTTANFAVGVLPAGAYIREIIVNNLTATAVTGGIGFGTTANATDIVTALTCAASCLTHVTDANLKLRVFSTSAATTINAAAITTWQAARVVITVIYGFF